MGSVSFWHAVLREVCSDLWLRVCRKDVDDDVPSVAIHGMFLACPVLKTRDARIWASFAPSFDTEARADWNYWVQLHRHTGYNEVCSLGVGMARWVDGAMSGTLDARPERTISCIYNCKAPGMMCSGRVQCRGREGYGMAKASDEALFGRRVAALLPQAERQRLERADTSTQARSPPAQGRLHRGSQLQQPACNPELWRDRGATAHVPCQALCVDANGKT